MTRRGSAGGAKARQARDGAQTTSERRLAHAERARHETMALPLDRNGHGIAVGDEVVLDQGAVSTLTYAGGVGNDAVFVPAGRGGTGWRRVDSDTVEVTGR